MIHWLTYNLEIKYQLIGPSRKGFDELKDCPMAGKIKLQQPVKGGKSKGGKVKRGKSSNKRRQR